jgi:hypothetical protein
MIQVLGETIRGDATGRSLRMKIMRHFNKTKVRKKELMELFLDLQENL